MLLQACWQNNYPSIKFIIIIIVSLLTRCGKGDKQSHSPWAAEQFELTFLQPGQGHPKHTHVGSLREHTHDLSLFFSTSWTSATLSDCRSKATPCTRCVFSISKGGRYLHDVVQSGNELPGPISRYVSGTFNRLTTHYHTSATLGIFQLTRRGVSSYSPPGILIVAACSKHSIPIFLASDRKSLDFYRGLSA